MKTKKKVPIETFLGARKLLEIQGQFDDAASTEVKESTSSNRFEIIDDHRSVSLDFTYSNEHGDQADIENWD